VAKIVWRRS